MSRKMVFTETVTAELLPSLPPLRAAEPGDGVDRRDRVAAAITDAVDAVAVAVEASAPGLSLGEQMVALSTALAHAAHNATSQQHSTVTLSDASTVRAVAALLGAPRRARSA
ncbi:MAG: RebB family R body protein [Kofleriaceae bacterium]|nr:RebB family R body protein [Kofleriaceae bacterium]MBP9166143.1 RebB family R body protein [Kofleriaceae bacterium]MBP9856973.1 RebB family R body protein [Kofleriaceae bacterium]